MRILHVIHSVDPRSGGPSHAIRELVRAQMAAGHNVSLLATSVQSGEPWAATDTYVRRIAAEPSFAGAELMVAALRRHGRQMLAEMFAADPDQPIAELLLTIGRWLPHRRDDCGYLAVEATVAARRDADVARPMRDYTAERGEFLAGLFRIGQAGGEIDTGLSPNALAHFCLLLSMGSALITPELHGVDDDEWAALLTRIVEHHPPDR